MGGSQPGAGEFARPGDQDVHGVAVGDSGACQGVGAGPSVVNLDEFVAVLVDRIGHDLGDDRRYASRRCGARRRGIVGREGILTAPGEAGDAVPACGERDGCENGVPLAGKHPEGIDGDQFRFTGTECGVRIEVDKYGECPRGAGLRARVEEGRRCLYRETRGGLGILQEDSCAGQVGPRGGTRARARRTSERTGNPTARGIRHEVREPLHAETVAGVERDVVQSVVIALGPVVRRDGGSVGGYRVAVRGAAGVEQGERIGRGGQPVADRRVAGGEDDGSGREVVCGIGDVAGFEQDRITARRNDGCAGNGVGIGEGAVDFLVPRLNCVEGVAVGQGETGQVHRRGGWVGYLHELAAVLVQGIRHDLGQYRSLTRERDDQ